VQLVGAPGHDARLLRTAGALIETLRRTTKAEGRRAAKRS
jgi:Asp-tRNA(Asn)/Glu-tRNA(Gln) amidotransferase A subunit family amidase